MHRTLVIRREYLHFIPKYSRYEKRHKNLAAHVSPAFRVEEGDTVTVGQCRPLSKTVRRDYEADIISKARSVHAFEEHFLECVSSKRNEMLGDMWKHELICYVSLGTI